MPRVAPALRWTVYGTYVLAAVLALTLALPSGVALLGALGLPAERVSFWPLTITGLPWTAPLLVMRLDSMTTLAVALVGNLLTLAIGGMLARGDD